MLLSIIGGLVTFALVGGQGPPQDDPLQQLVLAERLLESGLATDDTATYARADRLFQAVLESKPDDVRALRGAATVDLGLHRFADAALKAEAALAKQPNDHVALAALVDASIELGRYEQATELIDELLGIRPGVEAFSRLSYLHQLRGDDDAAIEAMFLAKAATADTSAAAARVEALLGELYYMTGKLGPAVERYRQAILLDSDRSDYPIELARVLAADGQDKEARRLVEEILAADAADTAALMLLVELRAVEVGASSAAEDAGDDETRSPASPTKFPTDRAVDLVVSSARSELTAGYGVDPSQPLFETDHADPAMALELAELIHQRRPGNIKADHALAWALHRNGRTDQAVEHLEAALRFDTTDVALHRHSAEIFQTVGDHDRADHHRQRVESILGSP